MTSNSDFTSKGEHRKIRGARHSAQMGADGIFDLASLSVGIRQGDPFDQIPVYATVSCGKPSIQFDDNYLQLNTWQILLRLQFENAHLVHGSIRKYVVQPGSFESVDEGKVELNTVNQQQEKLGYGVDVKLGLFSGIFGGGLSVKRLWLNRRTRKSSSENTTRAVKEIRLFGDFGQDTIGFGDKDYGDVRREFGFLAYEYPFDQDSEDEPLFAVQPIDPDKPVSITLVTTVPFDRLHIYMESRHLRKTAERDLERRGNEAVEKLRRQFLNSELKSRVTRNQAEITGIPISREGEFVVAIKRVEVVSNQNGQDAI